MAGNPGKLMYYPYQIAAGLRYLLRGKAELLHMDDSGLASLALLVRGYRNALYQRGSMIHAGEDALVGCTRSVG